MLGALQKTPIKVDLTGCKKVSDDAVKEIAAHCPNLETLILSGCYKITDESLRYIRFSNNVSILSCPPTNRWHLRILNSGCKTLRHIDVAHCRQLTDTGLDYLMKGCKHLESISIKECVAVSPKKIGDMIACYKATLEVINISNIPCVTDSAVGSLLSCSKLRKASLCYGDYKATLLPNDRKSMETFFPLQFLSYHQANLLLFMYRRFQQVRIPSKPHDGKVSSVPG